MVLALSLAVLAATPEYSVVVSRRLGLDAKKGQELAGQLALALDVNAATRLGTLLPVDAAAARLSAAGFPDPAVCNGAAACVASLAKVGGFKRLVAVQLVKIGSDVAIDASVVEGATGTALAAVTRTLKLKSATEELATLAALLLAKVPPADAPVATPEVPVARRDVTLTPEPPPAPPPLVPVEPPAPGLGTGRTVALGLGGGALVALAFGITLGVVAANQSGELSVKDPGYETRVSAVRGTAAAADVFYVTAGALAVGAGVAWFLSAPSKAPATAAPVAVAADSER